MIDLSWVSINTRYGPTIYRLVLNDTVHIGTVTISACAGCKYTMSFILPEPINCKSDVFKTKSILFDSKEDAMDACENIFHTWLKESKLLEEK